MGRLAEAGDEPLDHNQRYWGAWCKVPTEVADGKPVRIVSAGLRDYGRLWADWHGQLLASRDSESHRFLFDDRSLLKGQISLASSQQHLSDMATVRQLEDVVVVGEFVNARIMSDADPSAGGSELLDVSGVLRELGRGNGMIVDGAERWRDLLPLGGEKYSWIVLAVGVEGAETWGKPIESGGRVIQVWEGIQPPVFLDDEEKDGVWVARSELPTFFDVGAY